MSKIPIDKCQLTKDDFILLDTNILLYLFYPNIPQNHMTAYAKLWGMLQESKANLLISSIQISEFVNRCIRSNYAIYNEEHEKNKDYKKDYRSTEDYREKMKNILDIVKDDILKYFKLVNDNFTQIEYDKIFIYGFSYDFNDALLIHIAETYKAKIVTHDSDFANYATSIDIISNNKKLLLFS